MQIPSWSEIWPWALLIVSIVWVTYAAFMIKNEKDLYQKFGVIFPLDAFSIKVPHWWTRKKDSLPDAHAFERQDVKYNWLAQFEVIKEESFLQNSAQELANLHLRGLGIELDPDPIEHFGKIPFIHNLREGMSVEFFSIENTGTQNAVERIYAHTAIIKWKEKKLILRCLSLSSVLDGCVEGPYFEEVLSNLKFE